MNPVFLKWGVPALILVVGTVAGLSLARLDRTVKVTDQGVPVPAAQPPLALPQPAPAPAAPVQVPGGVFRSLDNLNAAAARVGCDTLKPNDPAGKLIDVAECLGERAVAPGQTK